MTDGQVSFMLDVLERIAEAIERAHPPPRCTYVIDGRQCTRLADGHDTHRCTEEQP